MKRLAAIASICTALAAPSFATQQLIDAEDCFNDAPQIETITDAMSARGWQQADLTKLDDRTIDHIAWTRMRLYLAGDQGGESIKNLLEIQRKTARGLHRKLDLETSKTRVMTRVQNGLQETAVILWLVPAIGVSSVTCQFTLIDPNEAFTGEKLAAHLPDQVLEVGGATVTVSVTRLNSELLPTELSAVAVTRREVKQ